MGISYKLDSFEGPLDLLLHLIEKNKVNIYDIPIVEITEQYLDYVRQMEMEDLNIVSEFLVMAATLLDIKSKMLLPLEVNEEGEEEDPRAELVTRLLEYRMYRYMAIELQDRLVEAGRLFFKEPSVPKEVAQYEAPINLDELLDGLTLAKLQAVFEQVMKRKEDKVDPIRSKFGTITKEPISLDQKIGYLLDYLKLHRKFSFRQILEKQANKIDIVVTFLAILELMKMGKISLVQEELFDEMCIEAIDLERTNSKE